MARRGSNYTVVGKKIMALATNQSELSLILKLTQQSISGKLTGKIAVSVSDLQKLAKAYEVPVFYFVAGPGVTPALARAFVDVAEGFPEMRQIMEIAATFPRAFAVQLFAITRALKETADAYKTPTKPLVGSRSEKSSQRASEMHS